MTRAVPADPNGSGFRRFLEGAPKAELHVHLRGAMPPEFFAGLLDKYPPNEALRDAPTRFLEAFRKCDNIRPFLKSPIKAPIHSLFHFHSFDQFLATYLFTSYFCRDVTDFRNLIAAVRAELTRQNIVYAEITVSVFEYLNQGIGMEDLSEALDEGARARGVETLWIADLVRNIGPTKATEILEGLLRCRPRSLVGITLGGSEHEYPPAQFKAVYAMARDHGLRLTIHAGEALGPKSVWDAVRVLGAERIGHGVRSVEDSSLVAHLAERQIPLEVCPTSNVRTGVYRDYAHHSLPSLHNAGIPISLNTDDPTFFRTTLPDECLHARDMGISEADIVGMLANGFRHAFMAEDRKQVLLEQFYSYCRLHAPGAHPSG